MKRQFSVVLMVPALLFGSACKSPPDQSIIVTQARAPGLACDFSDPTKYVEGGSLDVSVPVDNRSYFQVFGWENDLENISVTVTSQITSETPNTFIATTIVDQYNLVGGKSPPTGLVSISATIAPGGVPSTNTVGVFLLTQSAMADICGVPAGSDNCPNFPNDGTVQTLLVTFQITGALVGGGATQTNPLTYPLTLFKGMAGGVPAFDAVTGKCVPGFIPSTTSCGIPGRDQQFCVPAS
jgi:hypothetical protein